jgi:hypothetical protein
MAFLASRKDEYRMAALDNLDYLLGRNPAGFSYVTGFGDKTPMFIHHRVSTADSIAAPVPGFLAGGPNPALQDTADCGDVYPSKLPACAYLDSVCSYASNEIAINWNAPLVFLAGAVEALFEKGGVGNLLPRKVRQEKRIIPAIRQRQGRLDVHIPFGGMASVTVANLQGRVLAKRLGKTAVGFAADWPMQVVLVSVHRIGTTDAVTQTVLSGNR